jgi:ribosomal protein L37AE/L43A
MQRYMCPKCGAVSYSSVTGAKLGSCAHCAEPLAGTKGEVAPRRARRNRPVRLGRVGASR